MFYWLLLWGFVLKTTAILSFGATGAILAVWRQSEFWRQIVRRAPSQRGAQIRCRESSIIICGSLNQLYIEHSLSSCKPDIDKLLILELWKYFGKRIGEVVIRVHIFQFQSTIAHLVSQSVIAQKDMSACCNIEVVIYCNI